jgi:hypothetical protein
VVNSKSRLFTKLGFARAVILELSGFCGVVSILASKMKSINGMNIKFVNVTVRAFLISNV